MADIPPDATVTETRNGLMVRAPNGNLLPGTRPKNLITPENARAMNARRYDKQRQAFAAGVTKAIQDTGLLPPSDDHAAAAWGVIAERATTVLLDTDTARGFADLMQPIGRNAGWLREDKDRDDSTGGVRLEVWGDALDRVLDALRPHDDIIDADAT